MNLTYYLFPAPLAKFLDRDRVGCKSPTRALARFGKCRAPSTVGAKPISIGPANLTYFLPSAGGFGVAPDPPFGGFAAAG
jgi:hypothetical protein